MKSLSSSETGALRILKRTLKSMVEPSAPAKSAGALNPPVLCQLKIRLLGTRPHIWRRVTVPGDITLPRLHDVIQIAMGWDDAHLYQFVFRKTVYEVKGDWNEDAGFRRREIFDVSKFRLGDFVHAKGDRLSYKYDMGDDWDHALLVEKWTPCEVRPKCAACLAGARACPPEDCGGVYGFYRNLEILNDPGHPEREELVEWLGDEFDEEFFDIDTVSGQLARLRV
jgi:hypothetical protein